MNKRDAYYQEHRRAMRSGKVGKPDVEARLREIARTRRVKK